MAVTPPKAVGDVLRLFTRLESKSSALQASYQEIIEAMGLDMTNPDFTYYNLPTKRTYQPWEKVTDDSDYTVMVHRLHQIVEESRTALGTERSVQCLPPVGLFDDDPPNPDGSPAMTGDDKAQEYADMLEQATLHLWREWLMVDQYSLMGYLATLLGEAVGVLFWSDARKIPVFQVRSPVGFYPQASVDDRTRLSAAIFQTDVTGDSIAAEYPDQSETYAGVDIVRVYDYYDINERIRCTELSDNPLLQVPNPLGVVPVYIFPGILVPGIRGASAVHLALPSHNELQRCYDLEARVLDKAAKAPIIVNDPQNFPENPVWGPNSIWTVGPQGKVGAASFDVIDHSLLDRRIQDFKESVNNALDFSPISGGNTEGTQMTGKGVTAILGPRQARQQIRLATMNCRMESVMEDAFLMWMKKGGSGKRAAKTPLSGVQNGSQFSVLINPKDFNPDWLKVRVFVDSAAYIDRQAARVGNLQELRGTPQAMSLQRYLQLSPDCPDARREINQIKKERDEAIQEQIAAMQPQGPIQLQAFNNVAQTPEQQLYASERGAPVGSGGPQTGPASPASPATSPPGPASTPAAPGPEGGAGGGPAGTGAPPPANNNQQIVEDLATHFRSVQNVHGMVFLAGLAATGDLSGGIELFITDPTDKATLNNSMAGDPQLKQLHEDKALHFYTDVPQGGSLIDVTPGSSDMTPMTPDQVRQEVASGNQETSQAGGPQEAVNLQG